MVIIRDRFRHVEVLAPLIIIIIIIIIIIGTTMFMVLSS